MLLIYDIPFREYNFTEYRRIDNYDLISGRVVYEGDDSPSYLKPISEISLPINITSRYIMVDFFVFDSSGGNQIINLDINNVLPSVTRVLNKSSILVDTYKSIGEIYKNGILVDTVTYTDKTILKNIVIKNSRFFDFKIAILKNKKESSTFLNNNIFSLFEFADCKILDKDWPNQVLYTALYNQENPFVSYSVGPDEYRYSYTPISTRKYTISFNITTIDTITMIIKTYTEGISTTLTMVLESLTGLTAGTIKYLKDEKYTYTIVELTPIAVGDLSFVYYYSGWDMNNGSTPPYLFKPLRPDQINIMIQEPPEYKLNIPADMNVPSSFEVPNMLYRTSHIVPSTLLIDDKIYVFGGYSTELESMNKTQIYDIQTSTWSEASPSPVNYHSGVAININNKIYISTNGRMLIYDIELDSWLSISGDVTRVYHTAHLHNNKIYIIGGLSGSVVRTTIVEFDIENNSFTNSWEMITPRCYHDSVIYGSKIYIIGGFTDNQVTGTDTMEIFDIGSGTITSGPTLPNTIKQPRIILVEDDIYCFYVNSYILKFNITSNSWSKINLYLGTGAMLPTLVLLDKKIYIIGGGYTDCYLRFYDTEKSTLTSYTNIQINLRHNGFAVYNNYVYLIGGYNENLTPRYREECFGVALPEYENLLDSFSYNIAPRKKALYMYSDSFPPDAIKNPEPVAKLLSHNNTLELVADNIIETSDITSEVIIDDITNTVKHKNLVSKNNKMLKTTETNTFLAIDFISN